MKLEQIGLIHSPYKNRGEAPRQGKYSEKSSTIEVFPAYQEGLKGIEHSSHIIALYWGDRSNRDIVEAHPPWSKETFGVFATRSPSRPNPIAFCVAEILYIEGNILLVKGLDALDQSPLLDIKTYSPEIDAYPEAHSIKKKCT